MSVSHVNLDNPYKTYKVVIRSRAAEATFTEPAYMANRRIGRALEQGHEVVSAEPVEK